MMGTSSRLHGPVSHALMSSSQFTACAGDDDISSQGSIGNGSCQGSIHGQPTQSYSVDPEKQQAANENPRPRAQP